jgi:mannan endo-1,4-beta-mannosidase
MIMKQILTLTALTVLLSNPVAAAPQSVTPVFTTQNGRIHAPDGSEFIARGVNLQYGDRPDQALPAIAAIDSTGANMVRLQLRRNTTAQQLRRALDEAVRHKIPVMIFYWETDITCASDSALLRHDTEALWLKRWASVLKQPKYQPWIMLNIANEWGTSKDGFKDYTATYTDLIKAFRAEGFRAPIVIDAADCGQATASFTEGRGNAFVEADPLKNLIVSVHAYHHLWNSPGQIDDNISALKATGLPFVLGEFGDRELNEEGHTVDHLYLMQSAQAQGVGWLAWSWKGNGGATRVLDMSQDYGKVTLTRRGEEIVSRWRSEHREARP